MSSHGISSEDMKILKNILDSYNCVYVFGSRVKGSYKKFSDLDICLKKNISDYEYELLAEKFENSDLPFTVDVVEYCKVSDSFKKVIDKEAISFDAFTKLS
ncbi:nucleotidyltransferase domain-containing protein [bacterium]|jgi:uncharacterized protein|nr:nucleotidyltransferase domain-containing protein [bacterium]